MIYELDKSMYYRAEKLFTKLKSQTAIESIFNGKNEARLYVDNIEQPKSVFILNSWAYYYLAGDANNDQFNTSLVKFLERDFFPSCISSGSNTRFAFYPDSDQWSQKTEALFSNLNLRKSGKTYFTFNEKRFDSNWRDQIPEGFDVRKVSQAVIDSIPNNQEFVDYIKFPWTTVEQYLKKGLGYCAFGEGEFSTICISVFASENEREVGIKTFPGFQRKGLAYVTACAYIEDCLKSGLTPVWSCFSDNVASINLAKKLGYTVEASHSIYFAEIAE